MKKAWIVFAVLGSVAWPARAQRVTVENARPDQITHIRTAKDHVTVVELREPVVEVASGSSAFKIEWRDSKVFIQPAEDNVSTNLFIWTASGRLNFELEPAGPVQQMDFVIDQPQSDSAKPQTATQGPQPSAAPSVMEVLLSGQSVRLEQRKRGKNKIEIVFRDVIPDGDRLLFRYAICNQGTRPYVGRTPVVFSLNVKGLPDDLVGMSAAQLSEQEAAHLKASGQELPVEVLDGRIRTERLGPGQETQGVIAVKLPSRPGAQVLRFYFPADAQRQVSATLVL